MAHLSCNSNIYNILRKLALRRDLSSHETDLMFAKVLDHSIGADTARSTLILLREKPESSQEIAQVASVLRVKAQTVTFDHPYLVDNCGTGGDGKGSFNVSTVAAIVAAAAGAFVAKHGNRSVSSKVGSTDLLEALGVRIDAKPQRMLDCLKKLGIGFFHAPFYHPVMKEIAPIRKSIKGRTVFNLLGPLLNPVKVKKQVIGVCSREFVKRLAQSVNILGTERTIILCGEGGMDEATTFGNTYGMEIRKGRMRPFVLSGSELGFIGGSEKGLRGGNVKKNKTIALGILRGNVSGPKKDAVLLNAGLTLLVSGVATDLKTAISSANEVILKGKAYDLLKRFVEMSNR